jgi:hypothetical protein
MSNVHLVLVGTEDSFKVCAAFQISELAKTYASGFKHHAAGVRIQELAIGVNQDFRIGDRPFTVRFNRKGECVGVVENPPLEDFLWDSPPHRISEDGSSVDVYRWAPGPKFAKEEAEARLRLAPLDAWVERS